MAVTTVKDNKVFVPQVLAPIISAELQAKLKFAPLAEIDNTLTKGAGDTVTIVKYVYSGPATDLAEGVEATGDAISFTSVPVTIKKIVKMDPVTDEAALAGMQTVEAVKNDITMAIADKINMDCKVALESATRSFDGSASTISYNTVVDAADLFQDEDEAQKVVFIHPSQLTKLRKDANFMDAVKFPGLTMMTGAIGQIAGCDVVVSRLVKYDSVSKIYTNLIVKPGALKIYMKKNVELVESRKEESFTTNYIASQHYVAYLYDDNKVVKFTAK